MSGGTIADFPTGAELELYLEDHPRWYRLMHKFSDGGGWVREVAEDGALDNDRDGIRIVAASRVVRASRNVPAKTKHKKNSGGDSLHF